MLKDRDITAELTAVGFPAYFGTAETFTQGSVGYALRVSLMHPEAPPFGMKILSLDGVAPTPENIRNGAYPAILPVFAITLREDAAKPKVRGYIDWMRSPQGQQLLEKCGLTPASQQQPELEPPQYFQVTINMDGELA